MTFNKNNNWQSDMRTLSDSGKYLFESQTMSDITFTFNNEEKQIFAHSWILSMMSPIFYESFKNNFEVRKEIPVTDKSHRVFVELLRYMYIGECNLSRESVYDLMDVANKYCLRFLVEECAKYIESSLPFTDESACLTLSKAISCGHNDLKDNVLNYIAPRMHSILHTQSFLKVDKNTLSEILKIEVFEPITEMEIFSAVMNWGAQQCISKQMDVNGTNKRKFLGDIVKLIRFPTMTIDEFGKCIKEEKGLLTSDEQLSLLMCYATKDRNTHGFVSETRQNLVYLKEIPEMFIELKEELQRWDRSKYKKATNGITKFTVNKTIYLTGLRVCISLLPQKGKIEIIDDKYKILYKETFLVERDGDLPSKLLIMSKPTLLDPSRKYIIKIIYDFEGINNKFWCVDQKSLPWSKKENDIKFEFIELSPLLLRILFKPFY